MGVFGEFVYGGEAVGGDVYGPDSTLSADQLGVDLLLVDLADTIVVDTAFRDISNYTISVVEGSGPITVREVMVPQGLTTRQIRLRVDQPTKGTLYQLTINNLKTVSGSTVEGSVQVYGRRTKLENMMRGLPSHWDKRPSSIMHSLLAAISIEDERIGGSRSDDL